MENLFEQTKHEYEKYEDDAVSQSRIHDNEDYSSGHPDDIIEAQKQWFIDRKEIVFEAFEKEHSAYNGENIYFYGCSFSSYKNTFEKRLDAHLQEYIENSIISFIELELESSEKPYTEKWVSSKMQKNINTSLRIRREFLSEKAELNDYEVINSDNTYSLLKINNPTKTGEVLVDLSDTTIKQKLIYLHELGLLHELRKVEPFKYSVNRIAQAVSAIIGEKQSTIQSYINPIFNTSSKQDNSALHNQEDVDDVRHSLINNVRFNPKK